MSTWAGDDCADVWNHITRKARKEHRCCACREKIPRGATYHIITSIYDGSVTSWKRCERCEAMYEHLDKRMEARHRRLKEKGSAFGPREEVPDMELNCGHTYQEEWNEDPSNEVAELAFLLPGELPGALFGGEAG